jgi:hypothetical protein
MNSDFMIDICNHNIFSHGIK